jgi:hypothetical protein
MEGKLLLVSRSPSMKLAFFGDFSFPLLLRGLLLDLCIRLLKVYVITLLDGPHSVCKPSAFIATTSSLYDMIYLSATGLTNGGSSTVHIYTQAIRRTTQNKQYIEQYKHFGRM